jgi:hypothetical protein
MSNYWIKLGNMSTPDLPEEIFSYPVVEAEGHRYEDAQQPEGTNFWFKRTHSTILTITHGAATQYLNSLGLPAFDCQSANFLSMTETLGWHVDKNRFTTLNIGLLNSHLGRVEFEDGSSYVMQKGDVYCLDVTKAHQIVIDGIIADPRIILNISLKEGFNATGTRRIIDNIVEHISGN